MIVPVFRVEPIDGQLSVPRSIKRLKPLHCDFWIRMPMNPVQVFKRPLMLSHFEIGADTVSRNTEKGDLRVGFTSDWRKNNLIVGCSARSCFLIGPPTIGTLQNHVDALGIDWGYSVFGCARCGKS